MDNIKTTSRNAYNHETYEEYTIDFPTNDEISNAILKLDFPTEGITIKECKNRLSEYFNLSEAQKAATMKNPYRSNIFYFMVRDALHSLKDKGKVVQPDGKRKPYFLVEEGENPNQEEELKDVQFQDQTEEENTIEAIDRIYQSIHEELAAELLDKIKNNTSTFFEELVIDLLVAMGYGGSREDAEAVGRSGDGGIDGVINEDRLGLDVIYVQAKRWEANVGEPPIRDFIGALDGKGAQKGVFITTSGFNQSAERFAERSTKKIVLINGTRLAELMIEHDVGVSTTKTYEIKRVDSDYFDEIT